MSFANCIASAKEQGEISDSEARRLTSLYESLRRQAEADGPNGATFAAKETLAKMLEAEGQEEKRRLALTIGKLNERWKDVSTYKRAMFTRDGVKIEAGDKPDLAEAAIRLLEHHGEKFEAVEGLKGAITGQAMMRMEGLLYEFRRHWLGGDWFRHGKARLDNVVREAFGQGTGDDMAKGLAAAWTDTAEWLRRRFNDAGGNIRKLEKWGLPQFHDTRALIKAGREPWKAYIAPLLDLSRMRHPLTDTPVTAEDLSDLLDHVYDSVTQAGWATREASRQKFGRGAIATQHNEHRYLVFRDADAWLTYSKDFGGGDPFAAMMGYISRMSRDIAAMEILSPNPNATVEWLKQLIEKEGQKALNRDPAARLPFKGQKGLDYARGRIEKLDLMWSQMRGELNAPVNQTMADWSAGFRNIISSSVMGTAAVSSITDLATQAMARHHTGIEMTGMVAEIARGFTAAGKREAVAQGLILDSALHSFHGKARFAGQASGPEWIRYVADRVLTYSGLIPWTEAGRHAFGLAFIHDTATMAKLAFEKLTPAYRDTLERWGFTAGDWDQIRGVARTPEGELAAIQTRDIAKVSQGLADRWLTMINGEMEHAVPTGTVREKTLLTGRSKPGTLWGEIVRSAGMFRSYSAVFLMLAATRTVPLIASRDGRLIARGASYAGALLLTTTVMGGLALQLKQIVAGRDPRPMGSGKFWGSAMLQGGGLGLFGDFLFADINRYGGGFGQTLSGPLVQRASELWTLTGGNAAKLAHGEKTSFGKDAVNFAGHNVPGSNIWYLRLAWERLFLDQVQFLADPRANRAFKDRQRYWQKQYGQGYWWAPGSAAPARAPELGAAFR